MYRGFGQRQIKRGGRTRITLVTLSPPDLQDAHFTYPPLLDRYHLLNARYSDIALKQIIMPLDLVFEEDESVSL